MLQGIVDSAAAGINDHGMRGGKSVLGRKLRDVIDIRKLTLSERDIQRKCPIGLAFGRRARQANDERRDIPGLGQTAKEEFLGRPGLGQLGDRSD